MILANEIEKLDKSKIDQVLQKLVSSPLVEPSSYFISTYASHHSSINKEMFKNSIKHLLDYHEAGIINEDILSELIVFAMSIYLENEVKENIENKLIESVYSYFL